MSQTRCCIYLLALIAFVSPSLADDANVAIRGPQASEQFERLCYRCPKNSHLMSGVDCEGNFNDCQCNYGFKKWGSFCKFCFYECPIYSHRKTNLNCWQNFSDCQCSEGYYKQGYKCVKKPSTTTSTPYPTRHPTPHPTPRTTTRKPTPYPIKKQNPYTNPYPDNRYPTNNNNQYPSMNHPNHANNQYPVNKPHPVTKPHPNHGNSFSCPDYSQPRYGIDCPSSFDDCECDIGYVKYGNYCKFCNFKCPKNSIPKIGAACYESFEYCVCMRGYTRRGYQCVSIYEEVADGGV